MEEKGRRNRNFFQRGHQNEQQAHDKMLNLINHQGNANKNHKKLSPHTCQNGYHQVDKRQQVLARTGEKVILTHYWWEVNQSKNNGKQYGSSSKN